MERENAVPHMVETREKDKLWRKSTALKGETLTKLRGNPPA